LADAREARVSLLSRLALNEIPAGERSIVALRDAARAADWPARDWLPRRCRCVVGSTTVGV